MRMNMDDRNFVLKGNLCYSQSLDTIRIVEQGYLVCEDGISAGVFEELPERYSSYPLYDYGDRILIPGLVDLHIHAPQYGFRGLGMDMELLDWLNVHTFPEESKYGELEYAREGYTIFVDNLKESATTRACIFATVHNPATLLLMDLLEESGLCTMVGKVNMDRNAPDYLAEESAQKSAEDTAAWIQACEKRYQRTKPILTPRFIPSCSDELMERLGQIQKQYGLPVQSHLSENPSEIQWVKELCPWAENYGDAYDHFGMFGGECKTIMAHCVYSDHREMTRMKEQGVFVAHCPQSNTNIASGIAPIRRYLDEGLSVGLGSDVAGGFTESIFRAMTDAIQVSKLYWRLVDKSARPLNVDEAFYMGTKGGGTFFGKAGSFEKGYELDVVVLQDENLKSPRALSVRERLERLIYLSDDRNVVVKYVNGVKMYDALK